ncbi:MAG: pro-sigmaK processing inhibitor BofA family protein [Ruminococcus sp.]|nr:pro-sigmaK processing inhibitor BofA family protein [Ruminococcus sp.]MBQ3914959.1 pro-sigmaK processing inhibitor BofA family protein [Ruminococcus sp.]
MTTDTIFGLVCGLAAAAVIIYYSRQKKRLSHVLFGTMTGLAALCLVSHFGGYFGAALPLNPFNVCGSALLGVPFVVCMVVLKFVS